MTDLNELFMKISADHGSNHAQNALEKQKDNNKEILKKYIEFIVMNLQAELERLSSYTLGQIQTTEIGGQIKIIVEDHLNKALYLLELERQTGTYLEDFLSEMLNYFNAKICINETLKWIICQIGELNLIHDFQLIVDNLRDLDLAEKDRILTYLVILNIIRRTQRRLFLTR